MLPKASAVVFLLATCGTLTFDYIAFRVGGYDVSITAIVRGWVRENWWLKIIGIGFFTWLTFHLFLEESLSESKSH